LQAQHIKISHCASAFDDSDRAHQPVIALAPLCIPGDDLHLNVVLINVFSVTLSKL
jgi:hypothetical protein